MKEDSTLKAQETDAPTLVSEVTSDFYTFIGEVSNEATDFTASITVNGITLTFGLE